MALQLNDDEVRILFREVLAQAMCDTVEEGMEYFSLDNRDFLYICALAGKRPVEVLERVHLIANGLVDVEEMKEKFREESRQLAKSRRRD
jgi:hypothetical protein